MRPFLHRQLELSNATCPPVPKLVEAYLKKQIDTLLEQHEREQAARMEREENFKYKVPLIRLKIEYSGTHSVINMARFGEQFKDRIANRYNFLHFWRRSPEAMRAKEKRNGAPQADKDYVFVSNYEDERAVTHGNFFNTLDKTLTL